MRNFEKRFNRMRRIVVGFIVAVFVFIIGWFVLVGVIGVSIAKNPENAAEKVGETFKKIEDGWKKGYYEVVPSAEDSAVMDSLINNPPKE